MALSPAQSADRHWKIYQSVKRIILSGHPDAQKAIDQELNYLEDYGADTISYDVWSENPAEWEADEGRKPTVPLDSHRRASFKKVGFHFCKDGTVLFQGTPTEAWCMARGLPVDY